MAYGFKSSTTALALAILLATPLTCLSQGPGNGIRGKILNSDGQPVAGATVIVAASSDGWARTDEKGMFETEAWGPWFSVQHTEYLPVLRNISERDGYVEVTMSRRDSSIWQFPDCSTAAGGDRAYVGTGTVFSIPRPNGRVEGPWRGDHGESNMIVYASPLTPPSDGEFLNFVSAAPWGSDLPPMTQRPYEVRDFKHRGWVDGLGEGLGLDVAWESSAGNRSRWVGDRLTFEMSYEDVSPEAARYFDVLMESACVGMLEESQGN